VQLHQLLNALTIERAAMIHAAGIYAAGDDIGRAK